MSITKVDLQLDVLEDPIYVNEIPKIKLTDIVLLYQSGIENRCICYQAIALYGIIHDTILINDQHFDITISICPFSFHPIGYLGKWIFNGSVYNNKSIILENNKGKQIVQLTGQSLTDNEHLSKIEVKVDVLRNILTNYSDPTFLKFKHPTIFPTIYETAPPHKIVYLVAYRSTTTIEQEYKYIVLVPTKNTYNTKHNGLGTYIHKNKDDLNTKEAIISTTFLSSLSSFLSKPRIVNL